MLLSSGRGWEQQKHRGKATALFFIPYFQLPHPTGSAWGSCLLEMGNPNFTGAGMVSDSVVLKWWLAFLHTAPALCFISCVVFPYLLFFSKQGTLSSFFALAMCLTECVLFRDSEVVAFPGRNPRYPIEVMINGTNHAATAHCRRSRSTHQEPWTFELALSVPPIVGTEFIQSLPGKKNNLYNPNTNYK